MVILDCNITFILFDYFCHNACIVVSGLQNVDNRGQDIRLFVGRRAILNELDILRRVPRNATHAPGLETSPTCDSYLEERK